MLYWFKLSLLVDVKTWPSKLSISIPNAGLVTSARPTASLLL